MDWYIPVGAERAVGDIRREIVEYLRRHGEPGPDGADPAGVDESAITASELIGNAVRHTAGPAWVSLRWPGEFPVLRVADLGPGFSLPGAGTASTAEATNVASGDDPRPAPDPIATHGRGMYIVGELANHVTVAARSGAGSLVEAELPVRRRAQRSIDPPRSATARLPDLSSARPEGGFDREVFLQALVVQLAQTVERVGGPDMSESLVAQVGVDVGAQMEAEYRAATGATGTLTAEQIAESYVRLKAGIGGHFVVESVDEHQIVLVNTRCPFGDVVTRAPALCRMTSSVFGGIAARNTTGGADVVLEERIAVGDPGCRVVVALDPPDREPASAAHRYASPARAGAT